jgi:hypothetical protein
MISSDEEAFPADLDRVELNFSFARGLNLEDEISWPLWRMRAGIEAHEGDDVGWMVGSVSIAIVDLSVEPDPFDYLDQVGADMCELAGKILQISKPGLVPRLQRELDATGFSKILILHHVELEKDWRGSGWLGALLAGLAIEQLSGDCGLAFALASPVNAASLEEATFKQAKVKLRRVWRKLGFKVFQDDVLKMNLTEIPFESGLRELKRHL